MVQKSSSITFGDEVKKLEVNGFVLTETFHAPFLVLPRHDHECANVNLILSGSFREIIGNRPQEFNQSSLLFKPAGEHHANQYYEAGAHCLVIELLPHKLESVRRLSRLFDAPAHVRGGLLAALARKIYKEFRAGENAAMELMIEGLILEMLAEAMRHGEKGRSPGKHPRWLLEARDFIHANFAAGVRLSEVAQAVGVDAAYVARAFRKHYGCSVGDYARRLQMEYAERELSQTDRALSEIAAAAGFYDQSHFTNVFKHHAKMTPTEFRAAVQNRQARPKRS